jgi:hypothetical protein
MATQAINPVIGVDVNAVYPSASIGVLGSGVLFTPHKVGFQVWANDGKRYVFAQASGAISASTTTCTVNTSTFAASATGGSYTSPSTAMSTGDYGWFSAASV